MSVSATTHRQHPEPQGIQGRPEEYVSRGAVERTQRLISGINLHNLDIRAQGKLNQAIGQLAPKVGDRELLSPVLRVNVLYWISQLANCRPRDTSIAINTLGKCGFTWNNIDGSTQTKLLNAIKKNVPGFNAQGIATTLNAFGKMGVSWQMCIDQDIDQRLLDAIHRNAPNFNAPETAIILNALGKMGISWQMCIDQDIDQRLLDAIYRNALNFNAQNIAITLNALGKMGISWQMCIDQDIDQQLLDAIDRNAPDFIEQNIANTLGALGKMGVSWQSCIDEKIDGRLLDAIYRNAPNFNAQGIANTLNALSKMGFSWQMCIDQDIDRRLLDAIHRNAPYFNGQDIANILNALGKMGVSWQMCIDEDIDQRLLDAIDREAPNFKALEIENTVNALGKMGLSWQMCIDLKIDGRLLDAIDRETPNFNAQETVVVLHTLAKMNLLIEGVFTPLVTTINSLLVEEMPIGNIKQLGQILAFLKVNNFATFSNEVIKVVSERIKKEPSRKAAGSHLQLFNFLKKDFPDIQSEVYIENVSPVDIYFPSRRLIVQVDGSFHKGQQLVSDHFIDSLFRGLQYTIIRVNEEEVRTEQGRATFKDSLSKRIDKEN